MKSDLLDLFYNFVVKEAAEGRIDCYFKYNMIFNTRIVEDDIEIMSDKNNFDLDEVSSKIDQDNLYLNIPTLLIKNRAEFEKLLLEYVDKALKFYSDDNFYDEVKNNHFLDNEKGISKEKQIMTLLWSNATNEDFNNPCAYLRKRINFFELGRLAEYVEPKEVCYSETLDGIIEVLVVKNRLENETPYSFQMFLKNSDNGERIFEFPRIYMGISDNVGYIYAIQNSKHGLVNEDYIKKINRKMYKVNQGIDVKEETFENFGVGNLVDITPSFLVAANVVVGIFRELGINRVIVPSILNSRWNAKLLVLIKNKEILKIRRKEENEIKEIEKDFYDKVAKIQSNLTEKFLRIFRRLGYHHSSIGIFALPGEVGGSDLVLNIYEGEDVCNNAFLDETYSFKDINNRLKR